MSNPASVITTPIKPASSGDQLVKQQEGTLSSGQKVTLAKPNWLAIGLIGVLALITLGACAVLVSGMVPNGLSFSSDLPFLASLSQREMIIIAATLGTIGLAGLVGMAILKSFKKEPRLEDQVAVVLPEAPIPQPAAVAFSFEDMGDPEYSKVMTPVKFF